MLQQELNVDYGLYDGEQCSFEDIKEASVQLTMTTETQFEKIKNEKWFHRVFNMITFSKENEIRVTQQVQNLAQAQQLFLELLIRLSNRDVRISELVTESFDKIEKLSKQNIMLARQIKQLENKTILGISKEMDLDDLTETEGSILGGLLLHLMEEFADVTSDQRAFANEALSYLDIEAQEVNVSAAIDSVKNIDRKRKILTCCLEYIYLNNFTFDVPEEINQFLNEFDFGKKTIDRMKSSIIKLYKLRGVDGFFGRYGLYEEIEEVFIADFPPIEAEENKPKIESEEVHINQILHIAKDETKVFKNNIIHISAFIQCEGNLVFENCLIYYNESDFSDEITLSEDANLTLKDCTVECKGFDEKHFIQGTNNNRIVCKDSIFNDCAFFINPGEDSKLLIEHCEINNPFEKFIEGEFCNNEIDILYTKFYFNELLEDYIRVKTADSLFKKNITVVEFFGESIFVKECTFIREEHFEYIEEAIINLFNTRNGIFKNCDFFNVNDAINGFKKISECKFENCNRVVQGGLGDRKQISNCLFKSCESIIEGDDIDIERNQFIDCKNQLIIGGDLHIQFCEFINITNNNEQYSFLTRSSITIQGSKDTPRTMIEKCIFNGVNNNENAFLIEGSFVDKIRDYKVLIRDCNFSNCKTARESGKIIKEYGHYYNLFNRRREIKPISIEDCKGLDRVNKENGYTEDVVIKSETTIGERIGTGIQTASAIGFNVGGVMIGTAINKLMKDDDYRDE